MSSITIYPTGVFKVLDVNNLVVGGDWKTFQDAVNNYDVVNVMGVTDPGLGASVPQAWNLGETETDSRFTGPPVNLPSGLELRNERGIRLRKNVQVIGDEVNRPVLLGALLEIGGQNDDTGVFGPHNFSLLPVPPVVLISSLKFKKIPGSSIIITSCESTEVSHCDFSELFSLRFTSTLNVNVVISNNFTNINKPITISDNPNPTLTQHPVRNNILVHHCIINGAMHSSVGFPSFRHEGLHLGPTDSNVEIHHNTIYNFIDACLHLVDLTKSAETPDLNHKVSLFQNTLTMTTARCIRPATVRAAVIRAYRSSFVLPEHFLPMAIYSNDITLDIGTYIGEDKFFYVGAISVETEYAEIYQNNIVIDGAYIENGQDLRPTYAVSVNNWLDRSPIVSPIVSHNTISGNSHYGVLLLARDCFQPSDRFVRWPLGDPETTTDFEGNDWDTSKNLSVFYNTTLTTILDPILLMNNLENLNAIYDYLLDASVANAIVRSSDKEGPAQRVLDLTLPGYSASIRFKSEYEHITTTPADYPYPNWSRNLS